jgi:dihydropteroate synthase
MEPAPKQETISFVTGRLAEAALRKVVSSLAEQLGFLPQIEVLPITVAALMSPSWIAKQLQLTQPCQRLILPGYCEGDLSPIAEKFPGVRVERGPRDLRRLPEFFGKSTAREGYGHYEIEILAEINHAPKFSLAEIQKQAESYRQAGADVIDLGCIPGSNWSGVRDCVRMLRDAGFRVSIDSFHIPEIAAATQAGAELVLSVNASNRHAAADWGCEVVVIPDDFATLGGLETTLEQLANQRVPLRIDPILEPIGCGFAASLGRYLEVRRRYPDAEIMLGIGNLTELTDADSAGVNVLLLGFCAELGIRSVLTTAVINWARSSVRECDLARRLVHYAVQQRSPPKHLEPQLVLLRDPKLTTYDPEFFEQLAKLLKDHNYRLFAEGEQLHLVSAGLHLVDNDAFALFAQLLQTSPKNMDASHAFYLGYELAKAQTALTLHKEYRQDEALDWGYLTRSEDRHRLKLSGSQASRKANEHEPT